MTSSRCDLCHHLRMNWWQTLIVTVMPVLLTTAALFGQQWMTDQRAARNNDGEQQLKALAEARQIHANLLTETLAVWRPLSAALDRASLHYARTGTSEYLSRELRPLDLSRADNALAQLMVREPDEVANAADAFLRHAEAVLSCMQELSAGIGGDTASGISDWAYRVHKELLSDYMRLAKESVRASV